MIPYRHEDMSGKVLVAQKKLSHILDNYLRTTSQKSKFAFLAGILHNTVKTFENEVLMPFVRGIKKWS